jgi:hypothetical protein
MKRLNSAILTITGLALIALVIGSAGAEPEVQPMTTGENAGFVKVGLTPASDRIWTARKPGGDLGPSGRYHMARTHGAFAVSQGVSPQLRRRDDCYAWCQLGGNDPTTCFLRCG